MAVLIVLVLVMSASLLYGCAPKTEPSASASPSASATPSASPSASSPATTSPEIPAIGDPNSEVYTMSNRIPWSGLYGPQEKSRASIDKAIKADNKKDKVKVGYVTWTNGTPFFAAMTEEITKECQKNGFELTTAVSDGDLNKQVANIQNMVTLGVDVIIDCDLDVNTETPAIKDAVAAGVPVIGLGLPFQADSPAITTAATTYYEQGFLVGKYAADQYKDKEVIAATSPGQIGHTIAESKLNGFIGGFVYERAIQMGKPFPSREDAMLYGYNLEQQIVKTAKFSDPDYNWSVVASLDGAWSQEGGMKAAQDIVTAHPDINLFFTDNDQEGFGAIKALQQAGLKVGTDVLVASVGDGTKEAVQMVKDGTYLCLTLASPYTWAKTTTDLVYKIFHDGFDATNMPSEIFMQNVLVTKDNADQWLSDSEFSTLPDVTFTTLG